MRADNCIDCHFLKYNAKTKTAYCKMQMLDGNWMYTGIEEYDEWKFALNCSFSTLDGKKET